MLNPRAVDWNQPTRTSPGVENLRRTLDLVDSMSYAMGRRAPARPFGVGFNYPYDFHRTYPVAPRECGDRRWTIGCDYGKDDSVTVWDIWKPTPKRKPFLCGCQRRPT